MKNKPHLSTDKIIAGNRMRQDGKDPFALAPFARISLDTNLLLFGKIAALVRAVLDYTVLIAAPMTGDGTGLVYLGNLIPIN